MMKKLLIAMFALGALVVVPAEARCRKRCERIEKPCAKPCAPRCQTQVQKRIVQEPCTKWIQVQGTCDHEIKTTVTTCQEESKACVGPCKAGCANAVSDSDAEYAGGNTQVLDFGSEEFGG